MTCSNDWLSFLGFSLNSSARFHCRDCISPWARCQRQSSISFKATVSVSEVHMGSAAGCVLSSMTLFKALETSPFLEVKAWSHLKVFLEKQKRRQPIDTSSDIKSHWLRWHCKWVHSRPTQSKAFIMIPRWHQSQNSEWNQYVLVSSYVTPQLGSSIPFILHVPGATSWNDRRWLALDSLGCHFSQKMASSTKKNYPSNWRFQPKGLWNTYRILKDHTVKASEFVAFEMRGVEFGRGLYKALTPRNPQKHWMMCSIYIGPVIALRSLWVLGCSRVISPPNDGELFCFSVSPPEGHQEWTLVDTRGPQPPISHYWP